MSTKDKDKDSSAKHSKTNSQEEKSGKHNRQGKQVKNEVHTKNFILEELMKSNDQKKNSVYLELNQAIISNNIFQGIYSIENEHSENKEVKEAKEAKEVKESKENGKGQSIQEHEEENGNITPKLKLKDYPSKTFILHFS